MIAFESMWCMVDNDNCVWYIKIVGVLAITHIDKAIMGIYMQLYAKTRPHCKQVAYNTALKNAPKTHGCDSLCCYQVQICHFHYFVSKWG